MYRGLSILVVAASLIVLAGCGSSGGGGGPVIPQRQVSNSPDTVVASGTLFAGSSRQFELLLTSAQVDQQAIYFELESNLDLYVYNSDGSLYATSSGPNFFALGTLGLASEGLSAEPLALDAQLNCRGSCVIRDADDSNYFVRIVNDTGSTQSYTLYAYVDSYEDIGEFENDNPVNAVQVALNETEQGAIESIADVDYYYPATGGLMTFDTSASVDVVAEIIDSAGERWPLLPGEPTEVLITDTIEVWVQGDDSAAVSAQSLYFLTLN